MTYGTRCKHCRTSSERVEDFHELEVILKVRPSFVSLMSYIQTCSSQTGQLQAGGAHPRELEGGDPLRRQPVSRPMLAQDSADRR